MSSLEEHREQHRLATQRYREAHPDRVRASNRQYREANIDLIREKDRRRRAANIERRRIDHLIWHEMSRYGMRPEQRVRMILDQDGCCYLCGEPLSDDPMKVHMDHDHSCCRGQQSCGLCIRGIACRRCNRGIGAFGDDPDRMIRVAERLRIANAQVAARRSCAPLQDELPINITVLRKMEA